MAVSEFNINDTFTEEFMFWSNGCDNNGGNSRYSLYHAGKYGVDRVDFTPVMNFKSEEQCLDAELFFNERGLGSFCSGIDKNKLGFCDPAYKEFDVIAAPVYILTDSGDFVYQNEEFSRKYPTERMLNYSYMVYNTALKMYREEILRRALADMTTGVLKLHDFPFNPGYYLDKKRYVVISKRRSAKIIDFTIYDLDYNFQNKSVVA